MCSHEAAPGEPPNKPLERIGYPSLTSEAIRAALAYAAASARKRGRPLRQPSWTVLLILVLAAPVSLNAQDAA